MATTMATSRKITDNQAWPLTQTYTYDSLNRVATAQSLGTHSSAPGTCWAETYNYDAWGNLYSFGPNSTTQSAYIGCSQESGLSSSATTKNQLSTYTYDAAGNLMTIPAVANYTYDAENHLVSAGGLNYSYDGDGKRVMKSNGILYWYGAGSDPLFESDTSGYQIFKHFYFNCVRVARQEGWAQGYWIDHYVSDALGNARFVYGYNGAWDVSDYYPFGGERPYQSQEGNVFKFTGKERDSESGLDNFGARYNSSHYGRFMSPDPIGGQKIDPQTLNKYSYVRNNPINFTDPTGLYTCKDDNNQCKTKQDIAFEKARQQDLKSKDSDVVRAAGAYGDPTKDNHVSVGFADLDKKGEGGVTTSTLGADDKGNLFAQSDVTINSKLSGSGLDAAVGHEGSHVADAQDVVSSIAITNGGQNFTVGQNITRYQSEQRAYRVTDSILRSENETYHFACGLSDCILGRGLTMPGQLTEQIDRILANSPLYRSNGQPLSPTNQGGSVANITVPH
jgi:RHS repeat-associated protein